MRARSNQFAEKIQRDQTRDQQRPRSDDGTFRDVAAPSRLLRKTCQHGPDESAPDRLKSPRVYAGVERKDWPETRSRPTGILHVLGQPTLCRANHSRDESDGALE